MVKSWGAKYVIGTFVEGSPRIRSMKKMGYEFQENTLGWNQVDYFSTAPVLVAKLDVAQNIDHAIAMTKEIAGPALNTYPFQGATPQPRFVEVIK